MFGRLALLSLLVQCVHATPLKDHSEEEVLSLLEKWSLKDAFGERV